MDPAQVLEASILAQQQPMLAAMAQGESEVQRFYKNCTVFLTGGSGFLGKQLIEKLFRACQISKVYMLLRPKKEKSVEERMKEVLKDPCFDNLRQQQPTFSEKITAVEGDVSAIKLGIDDKDWETLTKEVNVIFHVAATTRFDETLRTATLINVRGTREAILLGRACKHLRSYVHVSTAYSHATTHVIGKPVREEFYKSPIQPDTLISMAENVDMERLNNITIGLIKDWPNTYTFTKAVAEELVRTSTAGLPICIIRPAIVICTYREPIPGWLDTSCVFGLTGLIAGGGLGLIQAANIDIEKNAGIIPCDYVNNAIIVAARETAFKQTKGGDDTKIYTVCSTHRNPITIGQVISTLKDKGTDMHTPKAVYYANTFPTTNKHIFAILSFLFQTIPAYVADFISVLNGKKRRFVKFIKKLPAMFSVFSYFTCNDWDFIDNNLDNLFQGLSKQDQAIFNFDVTEINWTEYILVEFLGIRKFILKDGLKGSAYALKKQKYLQIVHYLVTALYCYCFWKSICLIFYFISSMFSIFIGVGAFSDSNNIINAKVCEHVGLLHFHDQTVEPVSIKPCMEVA